MKTHICTLAFLASIVSAGIMAGIFFTWTNAVTPGIGRLDDLSYLSALKSMNRTILNPVFFTLFFMPVFALPLTAVLTRTAAGTWAWYLPVAAAVLYTAGCLCITLAGNVPLNGRLDQAALETLSRDQLAQLRMSIEMPWNTFNLVRTFSSAGAFVLLVLALL